MELIKGSYIHITHGLSLIDLTHYCLRAPPEIAVWILDTFDNNFGMEEDFVK